MWPAMTDESKKENSQWVDIGTEPMSVIPLHREDGQLIPCLLVIAGPHMGKYFALSKDEMTIGRAENVDIYVPEPSVSRFHSRLQLDGEGQLQIKDLNSTNGIFINGRKTTDGLMKEGDTLQVGKVTLMKLDYLNRVEGTFHSQLYKAGTRDPLTGLYNRSYLDEHLDADFKLALRHKEEISLLLLDLDRFKSVNDSFGHIAGDMVLRGVGRILLDSTRSEDIASRYGGEEFVVLLRRTPPLGGIVAAERICKTVRESKTLFQDMEIPSTISIGVAALTHDPPTYKTSLEMFFAADKALYRAKESGRDRVEVFAAQ